jgi:hypothetical protein
LSEPCAYTHSPLGSERDAFEASGASPGSAAPDGRIGAEGEEEFLADRLQGRFTVAYFGAEGPPIDAGVDVASLVFDRASAPTLFERFGVEASATYVFRPDGHVLSRCQGIDPVFAQSSILSVLAPASASKATLSANDPVLERDRLYDALSAFVDGIAEAERSRLVERFVPMLADLHADPATVRGAMELAFKQSRALHTSLEPQ